MIAHLAPAELLTSLTHNFVDAFKSYRRIDTSSMLLEPNEWMKITEAKYIKCQVNAVVFGPHAFYSLSLPIRCYWANAPNGSFRHSHSWRRRLSSLTMNTDLGQPFLNSIRSLWFVFVYIHVYAMRNQHAINWCSLPFALAGHKSINWWATGEILTEAIDIITCDQGVNS